MCKFLKECELNKQ